MGGPQHYMGLYELRCPEGRKHITSQPEAPACLSNTRLNHTSQICNNNQKMTLQNKSLFTTRPLMNTQRTCKPLFSLCKRNCSRTDSEGNGGETTYKRTLNYYWSVPRLEQLASTQFILTWHRPPWRFVAAG